MESFEDWLVKVPSLALKELAGGGEAMRPLKKPQVLELVRADPELALESYRIERESEEWRARQCPRALRDLKIRHGLVD
jgi:hypothetical protein